QIKELTQTLESILQLQWIYDKSDYNSEKHQLSTSSSANQQNSSQTQIIPPSKEIIQQLYHLAMMGDIQAIEGILEEIVVQDKQLLNFANEISKFTASFQTAKIRKFLKQFLAKESTQK
ncbi:MAG: two-component system response regulator, partial [Cyanobacteria bacterium J06649_11]